MASESPRIDRTVLPPPDPPFEGKIEIAFKDSEADFPEPLVRRRARRTCC